MAKATSSSSSGNEQESLLNKKPSPSSTNDPTSVQYGSGGQKEPLIQMTSSGNNLAAQDQVSDENELYITKEGNKKRKLLLGVVVLAVALGVYFGISSSTGHKGGKAAKAAEIASKSTNSVHKQRGYVSTPETPLSTRHPVNDLKVLSYDRSNGPNQELFQLDRSTQQQLKSSFRTKGVAPALAMPTNAWYQNLLLAHGEPSEEQRVYPVPYIIDLVGPIPGLRFHHPHIQGGARVVQANQVDAHGLTLGASTRKYLLGTSTQKDDTEKALSKKFAITKMTPVGITLEWTDRTQKGSDSKSPLTYSSSIVRGMPYGTFQYNSNKQLSSSQNDVDEGQLLPTVASEIPIGIPPLIDGKHKLDCDSSSVSEPILVNEDIELMFTQSDYTWLVFVSRPVRVQCIMPDAQEAPEFVPGKPVPSSGAVFALQFLDDEDTKDNADLVIRTALVNDCTYGSNPMTCGVGYGNRNQTELGMLLRKHKDLYPGPDSDLEFEFLRNETTGKTSATRVKFNWNVQSMSNGEYYDDTIDNTPEVLGRDLDDDSVSSSDDDDIHTPNLLMYALPHHQDMIEEATASKEENQESSFPTSVNNERFCRSSLIGPACLVQGSTWHLRETFTGKQYTSFRAPRPPQDDAIPALAKALEKDLEFELPDYFVRGAGDTYFSGKQIAKFGRILTIGEELSEICDKNNKARPKECHDVDVISPEDRKFQDALARLRAGVEIWINGTADTPFVYDDKWGGLVSCGCNFDEKTNGCTNRYPDCVAFADPGLNFGNAYYNDHHFHYGYHIYAAAAVAHFDPQWGRDHFEQVMLLIRDIANPSHEDTFFPTFRHKDWYMGSSWASGIAVSPLNGRNQESSSEAVASYEAIGLYGMEMTKAWKDHDEDKMEVAKEIEDYGLLLTASEVRSAGRYWHVIEGYKRRQYPKEYEPHVIGIMWNTMAQFQTWFGAASYLAYGIQMLPITAVSEERDSIEWARELYVPFAESCDGNAKDCENQGWSILVLAMLATVGHQEEAIQKALALPEDVFDSAGGNGHSLTNTIWYLSTRKVLNDPLLINPSESDIKHNANIKDKGSKPLHHAVVSDHKKHDKKKTAAYDKIFDCGCPETCDTEAMNRFAYGHTCRDRMVWLITEDDRSQHEACHTIGVEFPQHCAACDPKQCKVEEVHSKQCPPCSKDVCRGPLNLCQVTNTPFLCTEGVSTGGCSRSPWTFENGMCEGCCELSLGCED